MGNITIGRFVLTSSSLPGGQTLVVGGKLSKAFIKPPDMQKIFREIRDENETVEVFVDGRSGGMSLRPKVNYSK